MRTTIPPLPIRSCLESLAALAGSARGFTDRLAQVVRIGDAATGGPPPPEAVEPPEGVPLEYALVDAAITGMDAT
jgi:hypothetical protein